MNKKIRIGIFYDGYAFMLINKHYSRSIGKVLAFAGIDSFVINRLAKELGVEERYITITERHWFMAVLPAKYSTPKQALEEKGLRESLERNNIEPHFPNLKIRNGKRVEKGVDVDFAVTAAMGVKEKYDIVVIITGDGDFAKLIEHLNKKAVDTVLLYWDIPASGYRKARQGTAKELIDAVTYPIEMAPIAGKPDKDPYEEALFCKKEASKQHKSANPNPQHPNPQSKPANPATTKTVTEIIPTTKTISAVLERNVPYRYRADNNEVVPFSGFPLPPTRSS
jgi:uncharacterized LabA/DUF88 family protein